LRVYIYIYVYIYFLSLRIIFIIISLFWFVYIKYILYIIGIIPTEICLLTLLNFIDLPENYLTGKLYIIRLIIVYYKIYIYI
jgi:hypothetical protein